MTTFPILFLTATLNLSPAAQTIQTTTPESPRQWQCTNGAGLSDCSVTIDNHGHVKTLMITALRSTSSESPRSMNEISQKVSPKPTKTPQSNRSPVISNKEGVKPTNSPLPTPAASITPTPPTTTSPSPPHDPKNPPTADSLMAAVNQHRQTIGKPAFQAHPALCEVASQRKPELNQEIFGPRALHQGFRQKQLPFKATENMIHQQTTKQAINWWLNSTIHRKAIESDHTHACAACQDGSCSMIFSSLKPK